MDEPAVVRGDIVRLDHPPANFRVALIRATPKIGVGGDRRDEERHILRVVRIADIEGTHAGTAVSRARDILQAGKAGAYKAAMAELDERTKAHWQEQIAPELEDSDENEDDDEDEPVKHYTADAAGLLGFLLCSVCPTILRSLGPSASVR